MSLVKDECVAVVLVESQMFGMKWIMTQGMLSFKYDQEKTQAGMPALAGLTVYMNLRYNRVIQIH